MPEIVTSNGLVGWSPSPLSFSLGILLRTRLLVLGPRPPLHGHFARAELLELSPDEEMMV